MSSPWFTRLVHITLALLLAFGAVAPLAPAAPVRTAVESTPDADDDCDTELVVSTTVRYAPRSDRLPSLIASPPRSLTGTLARLRAAHGDSDRSADPLGSRLRC